MKKIILKLVFVIALIAAVTLLSSCGSEKPDETESEAKAETESPEPAVPIFSEPEINEAEASAEEREEERIYVSLGDSIAHGYGLQNLTKEAYSSVIAEKITEKGEKLTARNLGVDGQDSTGLLSYIDENKSIPPLLEKAELITISIGANNILGSALSFVRDYNDYKTNPSTSFTSEKISDSFKRLNTDIDSGLERLRGDIPNIITKIRSYSEDADIVFLACYNPYGALHVTLDWDTGITYDFASVSAAYVMRMNDVIKELADECGYTIADAYAAFEGKENRLVNASPVENTDSFNLNEIDPHPNKNGHTVIAETIYNIAFAE